MTDETTPSDKPLPERLDNAIIFPPPPPIGKQGDIMLLDADSYIDIGGKPPTIFGRPVIETKLDLGENDYEFIALHGHQEAVATADNGDGTFTHTFEEPQSPLPKEITISGPATFSPEFEQLLERLRDNTEKIMIAIGEALAPVAKSFGRFGAELVAAGIVAGIIHPLPFLPKRRWARRAFINSLARYGTGYPGPQARRK